MIHCLGLLCYIFDGFMFTHALFFLSYLTVFEGFCFDVIMHFNKQTTSSKFYSQSRI